MSYIDLKFDDKLATITLNRPKVNALNNELVDKLREAFQQISSTQNVHAIVLTGRESFFSFGFDVPGFMSYPKDEFQFYVENYNNLIKEVFISPKPVIAALNGHCVAGGCVLALACDYRIMISGKAKIALNEMTFGSTLFSCVTEILKYTVGSKKSEQIIYSGKMYSAEKALNLELIDQVANENEYDDSIRKLTEKFIQKDLAAFASIKKMLKRDTLNNIEKYEEETISEFVDVWYSKSTREQLAKIEIR